MAQWIMRDGYSIVPSENFDNSVAQTQGQLFDTPGGGLVTGIAWYRSLTGGDPPDALTIWDAVRRVCLFRTNDVPDSGSVGWQELDLSDAPVRLGNYSYQTMVSCHTPAHAVVGRKEVGNAYSQGAVGGNIPNQGAGFLNNAGDFYPSGLITDRVVGVDVRVETQVATTGSTTEDLDATLASYLTTAGANYAGSPLADIHTVTEDTYNNTNDLLTAVVAQQSDLDVLLSRLTEDVAAKLTVFLNDYGIDARGFFDQITAQVQDVTDTQADIIIWFGEYTGIPVFAFLGNLLKFLNGTFSRPQLAEGPDWELLDETDFVDNLLWPVEADVYRVTISAFDPAGTSEPVGTETRHAYLGKWCPFNVQFSSEWHYFNTTSADLSLGGRMPGLGLILYRPGTGHVQAWRRTEAP